VLVAAAVCPHPPLLVPAAGGDGAPELTSLRAAAVAAIRGLGAAGAATLLLVGDAPAPLDTADATGTLAGLGIPLEVRLAGGREGGAGGGGDGDAGEGDGRAAGHPALPLALTIGTWLLGEAGVALPARALGVPRSWSAQEAAAYGADLVQGPARVGLLVLGDGSACRTEKAPGALDPRAAPYDAAVARALAAADPAALLALDPALSDALLVAGRVPWQVLAGAAAGGGGWRGTVTADEAPFGVGYLVATWTRTG